MRFAAPLFLVLLVALPWFWRFGVRAGAGRARSAIRTTTALALILGASALQLRGGEVPAAVVYVLDRSDSMTGAAADALQRLSVQSAGMRDGDRSALVVFGVDAALERGLDARPLSETLSAAIATAGSNLERALRLARTTLPSGGMRRIVLVSDGNETAGHVANEGALAAAEGIAIDVMPRADDGARALAVTAMAAPATARLGEPLRLVVSAEGAPGTHGEITLERDAVTLARVRVDIGESGVGSLTLSDRPTSAGVYTYRASVAPGGSADILTAVDDRQVGAIVAVSGERRILYVGSRPAIVEGPLRATGIRVEHAPAGSLSRGSQALAAYDAVVLDDIAAEEIGVEGISALTAYVRESGGGLLILGSPRTLEPAVSPESGFDPILPVDFRPRTGQRAASVALVIVFDKSGSMDDRVDGVSRIEVARQAVRAVVNAVPPTDAVGVVAFDARATGVLPLRSGHAPEDVAARLNAIQPSGGTAIGPALEMARDWLTAAQSGKYTKRHVLLVSDGRTSIDDAARARRAASGQSFELSVVSLGNDVDRELLAGLASATGGRAYFPRDIRQLPTLAAREAARVAGGRVVDEAFAPQATTHPIAADLPPRIPALGGYVVGTLEPGAETVLQSPLGDPVLAASRVGLGKVAVYTADIHSSWSGQLRSWNGFATLVERTVRWTARGMRDDAFYARLQPHAEGMQLTVEAQAPDGTRLGELHVSVRVREPRGRIREHPLLEATPGRYEATISADEVGPYLATVSITGRNAPPIAQLVRGFYWSADLEYKRHDVDRALLTRLASMTGGRVLGPGDSPFAGPRPRDYWDTRPWLAALALALFLGELLATAVLDWRRTRRRQTDGVTPRDAAA
jgi:Ca-activated chloride channel homolog